MFVNRRVRLVTLAATAALLLLACDIEEDLTLNFDGSGTYRIKVTIPKNLADGFGDLRKQAEKDGFAVTEGATETGRFIILRKQFTNLTALNDDHNHFDLTITKNGFLRRDYRLRATLQTIGFGAYQRHFAVTMPCKVTSTSSGEVEGSRVRLNASQGGTIEITASGFTIPLSHNQKWLAVAIGILGVVLFAFARSRKGASRKTICVKCQNHLAPDARFCRKCGAGAIAQM